MRKETLYVVISLILLFLFIKTVEASRAEASTRFEAIERELDCVSSQFQPKPDISWSDVCYMPESGYKQFDPRRSRIIDRALDFAEQNNAESQTQIISEDPTREHDSNVARSYYGASNFAEEDSSEVQIPDGINKKDMRDWSNPSRVDRKGSQEAEIFKSQSGNGPQILTTSVKYVTGLRVDDLSWSISGDENGANPNILSELEWIEMKSLQHQVQVQNVLFDRLVVDLAAGFADIEEGENVDSDYLVDNKASTYLRSVQDSSDGEMYDLSAAVGWRWDLGQNDVLGADNAYFTLLWGYAHHQQNFIQTDGRFIMVNNVFVDIPFEDHLHGRYNAQWQGPWLGTKFEGKLGKILGAFGFQYHWGDYDGLAYWPLREEFAQPSFFHTAKQRGLVFDIDLGYEVKENLTLDFDVDIQRWRAFEGEDHIYLKSGGITHPGQQFNGADWESYALMLGATYHFN